MNTILCYYITNKYVVPQIKFQLSGCVNIRCYNTFREAASLSYLGMSNPSAC
jgi:hypothetical protein